MKQEETLPKIIQNRKKHYQARVGEAFDVVYTEASVGYAEQFERVIGILSARAKQNGDLEKVLAVLEGQEDETTKRNEPESKQDFSQQTTVAIGKRKFSKTREHANDYHKLEMRLSNNANYCGFSLIDALEPDVGVRRDITSVLMAATLVVLAEETKPLSVKELREKIKQIVPDFPLTDRTGQNIHANALRELKKYGVIENYLKKESTRIHLYKIPDKFKDGRGEGG